MSDVIDKEVRAPGIDVSTGNYIILKKVDSTNNSPLAGATFTLNDPHGNKSEVNINDKGEVEVSFDSAGRWTLQETKVPPGYQLNSTPIVINSELDGLEVVGDKESDWYDYDSPSKILTVKNAPIQSPPEGGTKMKVATDNSLKELIKLVKSQPSTSSGGILNVTLDYTIPSYSPVEVETKRKRVYADIPCVNSKVAMNAQITPNDNIENMSLLTYAEPFDGYIRCYFSEQPTEAYIIDSVELTPVTSIVKKK